MGRVETILNLFAFCAAYQNGLVSTGGPFEDEKALFATGEFLCEVFEEGFVGLPVNGWGL